VGLDPFLPMHSQYKFTEGYVSGLYSANEDQVVLYSIAIEIPISDVLQASISAA
jgi:hypothetical protein